MTIEINIYMDGTTWYGARRVDGEYDGCDELPVDDDAPDAEAVKAAMTMPLMRSGERVVVRVPDIDSARGIL